MKQKWKETGSVLVNVSKIICHKYCAGFLGQRRIRERRAEKNGIWIWPIANAAELHSHWKLFFPVAAPTAPEKTAIADCICRVADGTEKFVHVFAFDFHRPLSVWMRFQAKQPTRSRSLGRDTTNSWMHGFFSFGGEFKRNDCRCRTQFQYIAHTWMWIAHSPSRSEFWFFFFFIFFSLRPFGTLFGPADFHYNHNNNKTP